MLHRALGLDGLFGMTYGIENRCEIWNLECQEALCVSFVKMDLREIM
jgi:hypothetical protein